jgi:sulfoxide reductase catalytic subunit YedY
MFYPESGSHLDHVAWRERRDKLPEDKIMPEHLYVSRRKFIAGVSMVAATAFLAACAGKAPGTITSSPSATSASFCDGARAAGTADELGDPLNTCEDITSYNNFYEFSYNKSDVAAKAKDFKTSPWTVKVGGLVDKPGSFTIDQLIKQYHPEERIYRLRCVEAWSMVIPWLGFPLSRLLEDAQPQSAAKYVRFLSFYNASEMPGDPSLPFPYFEGLRLDEAMQDLTILATGLYGKPLPPQEGAPVRVVVPWKYGFKSAKSLLNIDLTADQPPTFWSELSPREYGFYANVNPSVNHPRWSQASERRIGELKRRPTLLFNGYDQVAPLYEGMDLAKFY